MKPIIPFALLGALLVGAAQAASTTPVGYETLSVQAGFNYLGLRLHQSTVAAGTFETVGTTSVTDTGADFSAISANASSLYILEIDNGSGIISEFLGSSVSGSTITTVDNLSAAGVANGASYKIRKASTLSSVFGANNSAGLTAGFFGIAGADVIFVPNGAGGFAQYYYDDGIPGWADSSGNAVNGDVVALVYTDGVVLSANGPLSLTITGEVKTKETRQLAVSGFNYFGSVYPAGSTLASAFDGALASIDKGFFGIAGADVFFIPGPTGLVQYYYDDGIPGWADASGNAVDATTIQLPSGIVFSNEGAAVALLNSEPSSYSTL